MRALRFWVPFALVALLAWPAAAQEEGGDDAPETDAPDTETPETEAPEDSVPDGEPRYLSAMRSELESMRMRAASCEAVDAQRARCSFTARGITTGRDFPIRLVYSDRTDTVYLFIERYLAVPADGETTNAVLRRLMELNWTLLLGKFEWDSTDGEVRLAMILNTDSNFDRRAFRSAVRGIAQLADRYLQELERLQRGSGSE